MASGNVKLSVGTVLSVSAALPATYNDAGFSALTWTDVGEVTALGEFGGEAQISSHTPMATGTINKLKGSLDFGRMSIALGKDISDAGQIILDAGFDGINEYLSHSFRVVDSQETLYFTAVIGSFQMVYNDANSVMGAVCDVDLDDELLSTGGIPAGALFAIGGTDPIFAIGGTDYIITI